MIEGRIIIESSSPDGIVEALEGLQRQFNHVSATIPVKTHDGRYISSAHYSNNRTIMEIASNVAGN